MTLTRRTLINAAACAAVGQAHAKDDPPNILFILADDLGYADLSCYGQRRFATRRLDELAAGGVRLTQGYSNSPVCSATRVALITGRYQYRTPAGLEEPIDSGRPQIGLDPALPTLPSVLKKQGYRTSLIGKWHMGDPPRFGPLRSGYDYFFGIYGGGVDYFKHRLFENETEAKEEGYLTDILADKAIAEIARAKKPFFLSLHFTAPHWPWEGPDDADMAQAIRNPTHWDGGDLDTYARMVESLDHNVGRVLDVLPDNTIVVFTSDNGGERFSDNWPFIGGKTELLEGGIRVPLIVRWPGRIPAGTTSEQVMVSMDFAPTLAAMPSDGENLMDVLRGAPVRRRKLYWRYKAHDQAAVRDGDWKYLRLKGREYLFNLARDQRERADLKAREPERFQALKADYAAWNATMPFYPPDSREYTLSDHLADR